MDDIDTIRLREYLHRLAVAIRNLKFAGDAADPALIQEGESLLDEACSLMDSGYSERPKITAEDLSRCFPGYVPEYLMEQLLGVVMRDEYHKKELTRPVHELVDYLSSFQEELEKRDRD